MMLSIVARSSCLALALRQGQELARLDSTPVVELRIFIRPPDTVDVQRLRHVDSNYLTNPVDHVGHHSGTLEVGQVAKTDGFPFPERI